MRHSKEEAFFFEATVKTSTTHAFQGAAQNSTSRQ